MSTNTIDTVLAAVAADLDTRWTGVDVFAWEQDQLPARPPVATMWFAGGVPRLSDQGPTGDWRLLRVTMRLYVSVKQREKAGQKQLRDQLDALVEVLAADATAGGAVRLVTFADGDGPEVLADLTEQVLVAEINLEVEP